MQRATKSIFMLTAVVVVSLFLLAAKDQPLHEEYQAQAMGQSTQMGQTFNVTIHIEEYSTPEERQVLVDAFNKSGSQGLFNALNKMKSKGQLAVTGTLGTTSALFASCPVQTVSNCACLPIVQSHSARPGRIADLWITTYPPLNWTSATRKARAPAYCSRPASS